MDDIVKIANPSLHEVEGRLRSIAFDKDYDWIIIQEWTNFRDQNLIDPDIVLRFIILIHDQVEIKEGENTIVMNKKEFSKEWFVDNPLFSEKSMKNKYIDVISKNKRVANVKKFDELSYVFSDIFLGQGFF